MAYNDLSTFEFGCVVEVFGLPRPELGTSWYDFAVVAAEPGPINGRGGVAVTPDGGLDLLARATTIVIPGWRGPDAAVPALLCAALRDAHGRGARIVSICTGAFVLAAAGLLAGRRATTHWRHAAHLAAMHPDVIVQSDQLYVDEGRVLTSAGSAAGLDLCMHLVRKDFGPHIANHVARRLVISPHREGSQAQYVERPIAARAGSRLVPLMDVVRASLQEDWPVERLAREAGMSPRGLQRRFLEASGLSAGEWVLRERLSQACDLLETTGLSIDDVAALVGFGSATTLRAHFRNRLDTTPVGYRQRAAVLRAAC